MQLAGSAAGHRRLRAAAVLSRAGTGSAAMHRAGNAGAGRRGCRGLARQTNNHSPAVHPHPIDVYLREGNNGGKTGRNHFFSFLSFFLSFWLVARRQVVI